MDACVIGYGMVGKATALAFGIDKYFSRTEANITLEEASKCKYIFICLPTPCVKGHYFVDDIKDIIQQIDQYPNYNDRVFILRSTVYPGFTKSLGIDHVVFNPEFLSEATWEKDAKQPWIVVIGCDNPKYGEVIKGLYQGRYKYVEPIVTDTATSEMIKLTMNNFFSLKVAYANEIYDYAQLVGANYEVIKKAMEIAPWGSKNHWTIYYKGKRGIHGNCLPKDLEAFANLTNSDLLRSVEIINMIYK